MEQALEETKRERMHPQDATRRSSDQNYSEEFLRIYYKKKNQDGDKND
jgi:hypothetical protein